MREQYKDSVDEGVLAVLFEPKARLEMALVAAPPVIDLPREARSLRAFSF